MLNLLQYLNTVRRRRAALVLLVAVIGGCAQKDDGVIRFGLATPPVTLDPRFATDATSYRLTRLIYQALVDFDATHRPVSALADWQQLSPLHYRFRLRASEQFHDGSALQADDVVATYRSILDPRTASPHRGSLTNIKSIETPSVLVVDFFLTQADPLFPGLFVIVFMSAYILGADRNHL